MGGLIFLYIFSLFFSNSPDYKIRKILKNRPILNVQGCISAHWVVVHQTKMSSL